jgi:hypothetical protein
MNGINTCGGILVIILLLFACKGPESKDTEAAPEILPGELNFEQQYFEKELASCTSDSMTCARVSAVYPLAIRGNEAACHRINDSINYYVRESLSVMAISREEVYQDLDTIAQQFLSDYQEVLALSSDYQLPWTVETKGEIVHQSPRLVAVELENYSFTGGAHPNSYTTLLNFDVQSGQLLNLEDMIRDVGELKAIVEEKFRVYHDLEGDTDLNEAGFFWDQDFYLPSNFSKVDSGMYFLYNAYEAAAYAVGTTELFVSNEELKDLLK